MILFSSLFLVSLLVPPSCLDSQFCCRFFQNLERDMASAGITNPHSQWRGQTDALFSKNNCYRLTSFSLFSNLVFKKIDLKSIVAGKKNIEGLLEKWW